MKTQDKNEPHVEGLEEAEVIARMLEILSKSNSGGEWYSDARQNPKDPSNKQIIEYLAEQGRDIRANIQEQEDAAQLFANEIVRQMSRVGRVTKNKVKITAEQQAKAGIIGGIRKAMKYIAGSMSERVKSGTTNDESKAKAVTEKYAKQRKRKYGVAESVVYIATRQLATALLEGKIKIFYKNKKSAKALK